MRILMLTPRFPYPPDRGDTVRSWHVLESLARRHDVWLACVDRARPPKAHNEHVRSICRDARVFTRSGLTAACRGGLSALAGRSFTEGYFSDPRLNRLIRRWSATIGFDALWTYSSSIAPAVAGVPAGRRVLDMGDVDSVKWQTYARRSASPLRWFYRREAWHVRRLEAHSARDCDVCLLVNQRERDKLTTRLPGANTGVLPTMVDVESFSQVAGPLPAEPVVGMVGSMFYPPNVRAVNWFGRWVWPQVRARVPEARWLIVGSRPARQVRRWGRDPNVTVTGYVSDVRPYLNAMRVFVNAVDGDIGVQSKLVVAMAAGRPAVVTPDSAEGIDYSGCDPPPFVVARSAPAFVDSVVRLLRDDAHARGLAGRARAVALRNYSAERLARAVEFWLAGQDIAGEQGLSRLVTRHVSANARNLLGMSVVARL